MFKMFCAGFKNLHSIKNFKTAFRYYYIPSSLEHAVSLLQDEVESEGCGFLHWDQHPGWNKKKKGITLTNGKGYVTPAANSMDNECIACGQLQYENTRFVLVIWLLPNGY